MERWLDTPLIVTVVIATVGALVGIGIWVGRISANLGHLKDTADQDRKNFKDILDKDRSVLKDFMTAIREDIKKIFQQLPPSPVSSSSPLRLTDLGDRIADDIQAKDWAAALAHSLFDDIGALEPFEIDEYCESYVRRRLDDEWKRRVARCAFDFGIDRDGVLSVLRVVLRDALLQLRDG